MLACAACAREKQHLLGQLLKEIQINQSDNAMPNTGCKLFLSWWVSGHPFPSHRLTILKVIQWHKCLWRTRGWSLDAIDSLQSAHLWQTKALHTYAYFTIVFVANNTLFFFLFSFDCCKFSALDTWNSPARPPLKAQGSWSPLRNCAEDWLRHPVRSRAKRTLLPQDGALWHRWSVWENGEEGGHTYLLA